LRKLGEFSHVPGNPILPLIVGDVRKAVSLSEHLLEHGVHAPAVRPPTVPPASARVRFTVRADHTEAEIAALHTALSSATMRSL
jgi:7-keto-8-aminopelargonate synthetase-like enzyme